MKKILRWTAAAAGFALMTAAVFGGTDTGMSAVTVRFVMLIGGLALITAVLFTLPAAPRQKYKYREFDVRDFYTDELEQRRKAKESWESIKRANEK